MTDDEDKEASERFEQLKQRHVDRLEEAKQRHVAQVREQLAIHERLIGLPKFMWDRLDAYAKELSMTPSELVRGWLIDRLGGEK